MLPLHDGREGIDRLSEMQMTHACTGKRARAWLLQQWQACRAMVSKPEERHWKDGTALKQVIRGSEASVRISRSSDEYRESARQGIRTARGG